MQHLCPESHYLYRNTRAINKLILNLLLSYKTICPKHKLIHVYSKTQSKATYRRRNRGTSLFNS